MPINRSICTPEPCCRADHYWPRILIAPQNAKLQASVALLMTTTSSRLRRDVIPPFSANGGYVSTVDPFLVSIDTYRRNLPRRKAHRSRRALCVGRLPICAAGRPPDSPGDGTTSSRLARSKSIYRRSDAPNPEQSYYSRHGYSSSESSNDRRIRA